MEQTPKFEDAERMGPEEARLTANMMQLKVKEIVGHEPTVADYDMALETIEEMEKVAAEEPPEGVVKKMMRMGNKAYMGYVTGFEALVTLGSLPTKETLQVRARLFSTAKERLEQLKQRAEKVG